MPRRSAPAKRPPAKPKAERSRQAATHAPALLRADLQALGKTLMDLQARLGQLERSLKATQATVGQWQESPDHDTRLRRLETHQNTIDGREIRLVGAIEKAVIAEAQANALIGRFEKGLNRAIQAAMAGGVADLVASIKTPHYGDWYTEAYAEAHKRYESSIRS